MRLFGLRSILVGVLSANMVFTPQLFAQPGTTIPVPPGGEDLDPTRPHPTSPAPADIDPQVTIPTVLSALFGLTPTSLQQYVITSASAGPTNFPISIQDGSGASVGTGAFNAIARADIESLSDAITASTEEACLELSVTRPAPTIVVFAVAGSISSGSQSKIINAIGMTFFLDAATPPSTLTVLVPFALQTTAAAALAENSRAAADLNKLGEQVAARGGEGPCDFASAAYVNATPAGKCLYTKKCAYSRAWADFDLSMAGIMATAGGATGGCLLATILSPGCFAAVAAGFAVAAAGFRLVLSRARTRADEDYCKCLIDAGLKCDSETGVAEQ